jgi:large subunit ribosomal protein L13
LLEKNPEKAVEKAIKGMLPKNKLGAAQLTKLKVYAGPAHPHAAQQPKPFIIDQVAQ